MRLETRNLRLKRRITISPFTLHASRITASLRRLSCGAYCLFLISLFLFVLCASLAIADKKDDEHKKGAELSTERLSPSTQACIACHALYTPGIVHDWLSSRHSQTTPADAMKKPELERRISADTVSEELAGYVVGCYECHSRNPKKHKDNFEHMGFRINVIVSPDDCKTCHPVGGLAVHGKQEGECD